VPPRLHLHAVRHIARTTLLALACVAALPAGAFDLDDTLLMHPDQRTWYYAGIYDRALIDLRSGPCAGKLHFDAFMRAMGRFVSDLPADPAAPLRKKFGAMPAAAVAQLVIESECAK